jgi:hypothetical protein
MKGALYREQVRALATRLPNTPQQHGYRQILFPQLLKPAKSYFLQLENCDRHAQGVVDTSFMQSNDK